MLNNLTIQERLQELEQLQEDAKYQYQRMAELLQKYALELAMLDGRLCMALTQGAASSMRSRPRRRRPGSIGLFLSRSFRSTGQLYPGCELRKGQSFVC